MTMLSHLNALFHDKIPLFILINFILLIILIYFNWEHIKKFFLKIDKKLWLILVLIFLTALMLRIFIPPHHHIMYIDEALYMEAGKDMLLNGSQGDYAKSIGWPFILRIVFGFFGIINWVAIYTSIFLGALTIFNMFFLAFIITKRKDISLVSALLFSLFPAHIRWSATAENNVASLFFITLTIFFCFLYYKNKKASLLWLSAVSLAFTAQFRPENNIFPILFFIGNILMDKKFLRKLNFKFILPWLVLAVLSSANLIQVLEFKLSTDWIESDTAGEQTGSNWSFHNLIYNSPHYGVYIFNSKFQPIIFSFLFMVGLIYMLHKQRKEALFLLMWFCLMWFVYFFSWFQTLGGGTDILCKIRFFMSFYPITVIFAAYGILLIKELLSKVKKYRIKNKILPLIAIVLVILFVPYSIKASTYFNSIAHRLETRIPELAEKDIGDNCIIIANFPTILKSTTNLNVADIGYFLAYKSFQEDILNKSDCVLFFEDIYCLDFDFGDYKEKCQNIKKNHSLEPYVSYSEGDKTYTFYNVRK